MFATDLQRKSPITSSSCNCRRIKIMSIACGVFYVCIYMFLSIRMCLKVCYVTSFSLHFCVLSGYLICKKRRNGILSQGAYLFVRSFIRLVWFGWSFTRFQSCMHSTFQRLLEYIRHHHMWCEQRVFSLNTINMIFMQQMRIKWVINEKKTKNTCQQLEYGESKH